MKSSFSAVNGCVDVAVSGDTTSGEQFLVRDTKHQGDGPKLVFTRTEWDAFVAGVKAGEFDFPLSDG